MFEKQKKKSFARNVSFEIYFVPGRTTVFKRPKIVNF